MLESDLMKRIQVRASELGMRLFRMNSGIAWAGERVPAPPMYGPRAVVLLNARAFRAGVKGISDLCGWKPVTITAEMVGQTVAVFYAAEVKTGTKASEDQKLFIEAVRRDGGFGIIARSEDDL